MKIKGFDKKLCCRGMQYEVGKEYSTNAKNITSDDLCSKKVLHYCDCLQNVHEYYSCSEKYRNRFCEIEVLGEEVTDGKKYGSNHIKIVREITGKELNKLKGLINGNTGLFNSGDRNSGDFNSGDLNSGDFNSGDLNSGYFNSGDRNSGDFNSGDRNSGYFNSGAFNSGDRNSGYLNSGDFNSGDLNSGDLNSGYLNSGVFCTKKQNDTILFFNKESNMTWSDWCNHPAHDASRGLTITKWVKWKDMTDDEKEQQDSAYICGGYLKTFGYKEAWANLWETLDEDEKNSFKTLPNFSADIFEEITGIRI